MLPATAIARGPYALAEPSPARRVVRRFIALAVVGLLLYVLVRWLLGAIGVGNHLDRRSVQLDVENSSNVTVSLEGGLMQRPDGRLKLWPDDRIVSNAGGHALLTFFDGTVLRIDEQSEVAIDESSEGTKTSSIGATLNRGALWIKTPNAGAFTGSVARTITTDSYVVTLPSDADVVLGARTVLVFNADGDGVTVEAEGSDAVAVGEGQQLLVPEDASFDGDLRRFRSAMDPLMVRREFIEDSRSMVSVMEGGAPGETPSVDVNIITINVPVDGQTVSGSTVRVQGAVGARIERVRVNGYPATINREQGTYSQELALPVSETFTIRVEALDRTGVIVEQQERTVRIGAAVAGNPPAIVSPGKNGETVHTAEEELEIRGTAPAGTAVMYVNDYKLQLFRTGDTEWSYLASTRLSNLKQGDNVFNVVAESATGVRSTPATLTISLGQAGPTTPAAGTSTSSAAPTVSESTLPTNDPLKPGTLAVTAPSGGTSTSYSGTGFLLEGTTSTDTASVWVNGYQLKLYTQGKTFWNYWATTAYGTLKPGTNVYRIVARDAQNRILDVFTYTVEYQG